MYNYPLLELPKADYSHRRSYTATAVPHGRYATNYPDYVSKFATLKSKWESDNLFVSSLDEMVDSAPMQDIIALESLAVPLIAANIRATPSFLYLALPEIFGFDPLPDSLNGDIAGICRAWVEWIDRQPVHAG